MHKTNFYSRGVRLIKLMWGWKVVLSKHNFTIAILTMLLIVAIFIIHNLMRLYLTSQNIRTIFARESSTPTETPTPAEDVAPTSTPQTYNTNVKVESKDADAKIKIVVKKSDNSWLVESEGDLNNVIAYYVRLKNGTLTTNNDKVEWLNFQGRSVREVNTEPIFPVPNDNDNLVVARLVGDSNDLCCNDDNCGHSEHCGGNPVPLSTIAKLFEVRPIKSNEIGNLKPCLEEAYFYTSDCTSDNIFEDGCNVTEHKVTVPSCNDNATNTPTPTPGNGGGIGIRQAPAQ